MVNKIIDYCSRNIFIVFIFTAFLIVGSIVAIKNTPLDAIPDLSDVQVIVFTEWKGRNPRIIEDQITYPITTKLLSAPKVRDVRASYEKSLNVLSNIKKIDRKVYIVVIPTI